MPRLSADDERELRQFSAELGTLRLGGYERGSVFAGLLRPLGELLRCEVPVAYGLNAEDSGARVDFLYWEPRATRADARAVMDHALSTSERAVCYKPLRPDLWQQNRVVTLDALLKVYPNPIVYQNWRRLGIAEMDQLRVLICENDTVIAWVGGYRPLSEPFGPRERIILKRLIAPLRARLRMEQQLTDAPLAKAALDVAMNALPSAAWVADRFGRVHHANALGLDELELRRRDLSQMLRDTIGGRPGPFAVHRLVGSSAWFVVRKPEPRSPAARMAVLGPRWRLTPREAEVLEELSKGRSNRETAAALRCGERTVEVHVTRVLFKAGVSNRSELIARFWSEPIEDGP